MRERGLGMTTDRDRDEGPAPDPVCERCEATIIDPRTSVVREAMTFCCASCARAAGPEPPMSTVPGCARCGASIVDRAHAVERGGRTYCCGNCAAAGVEADALTH